MTAALDNLRFSAKLPLVVTLIAAFTALSVGTVSYFSARSLSNEMIQAKSAALLQSKQVELSAYLDTIEQDLRVVAANDSTIAALNEFRAAWQQMASGQSEKLHRAYITDNPNPVGKKDNFDRGNSGSGYDDIHAARHPWLHQMQKERSYYDAFLIDAPAKKTPAAKKGAAKKAAAKKATGRKGRARKTPAVEIESGVAAQ